MLFNSYQFIFCFFPLALLAFMALEHRPGRLQYLLLLAASIAFYAWWDIRFVPLLVGSFTFNYLGARALDASGHQWRWWLACIVISCNLLVLAIFKYFNFFAQSANAVLGSHFVLAKIILPLGISFFTFEQIGFIADVYRGRARPGRFIDYAIFVSFFPRLVAGPILRYDEIASQISDDDGRSRDRLGDVAVGLTIFFIGLVKKSLLADGIAPYASEIFGTVSHGGHVDFLLSWGGVLSYSCQLYFDFSGYSDMAIGAARCFGIRLPMNFASPYKATSIIDFWRRWHITLSRFLRDYLYIPLGGNRRGPSRRYANLMVTMLLGGLWHGASWTFMAWGGLHGIYLAINHGWLALAERSSVLQRFRGSVAGKLFGFALTFGAVLVAWTFFRSASFAAAFDMIRSMTGHYGAIVPSGFAYALQPLRGGLQAVGVRFGDTSGGELVAMYLWVATLLSIALFLPNTQELLERYCPVFESRPVATTVDSAWRLRWSPSIRWAAVSGAMAFVGIISITHVSEFLYWQF